MGPFLHLLRTRDVPKTFKDMTIRLAYNHFSMGILCEEILITAF